MLGGTRGDYDGLKENHDPVKLDGGGDRHLTGLSASDRRAEHFDRGGLWGQGRQSGSSNIRIHKSEANNTKMCHKAVKYFR
jgi:hypothetical protein